MKTENKIISLVIISLLVVGFAVGLNLSPTPVSTDSSGTINYGSVVCVYKNGILVSPCTHNLLVNKGKDLVALAVNGTAATITQIAVGNNTATQLVTDTSLATQGTEWAECGLAKATGTYVYRGVGAWNVTKAFTSSCDNIGVNATALQNTADSVLFAETTFTSTTLQTNDILNVTWGIYIS